MGALDVFDHRAEIEYATQHPAKDLDPPASPFIGLTYAMAGIVLLFAAYVVCVRYWRAMGAGVARWVARPITTKLGRGGRALRGWWLED
ncbi:hypothetical protein IVB40_07575 [Bradyrhizobium sp. 40]|uniref:hypothetical protein n=1 Tax=Bradyrhizobium sp. 40 TaxID=2782674 RepID=UPI001FFEF357|nr:hypothetical protein [Bradyrhizobium sp. 40]UPJ43920.1 hypothetical protein IVB40_07575 [Bradyrhizobium sp. 40]